MLYLLAEWLGFPGPLNLIRYLSFRSGAAIATALVIGLIIGPRFIIMLRARQGKGQPIREDGPQSHLAKRGTPTMGGLMILIALIISSLLWMDLSNSLVWACLFVTAGFGIIGFADDYDKVTKRSHKGVSAGAVADGVCSGGHRVHADPRPHGHRPLLAVRQRGVGSPWLFLLCVRDAGDCRRGQCGQSDRRARRAGNLSGDHCQPDLPGHRLPDRNVKFAEYLGIPHIAGAGDLAIFCGAMIGAGLAFLWFNAPPAAVFMGDTGSLALGGALGAIAVTAQHEIVLAIVGGLFVVEALSVIIQVFYYKRTGKRVFRMAPIHHHFEQLGWAESTVVIRFWIVSIVLALAGLATLKLR